MSKPRIGMDCTDRRKVTRIEKTPIKITEVAEPRFCHLPTFINNSCKAHLGSARIFPFYPVHLVNPVQEMAIPMHSS